MEPAAKHLYTRGETKARGLEKGSVVVYLEVHFQLFMVILLEVFNGETKQQAGPHGQGFTKNADTANTWVLTSHIHAMLRSEFKNKIHMSTSSAHKENTSSHLLECFYSTLRSVYRQVCLLD